MEELKSAYALSMPSKVKGKKLTKRKVIRTLFILVMFVYPVVQFTLFWILPNANSIIMAFQREIVNDMTGRPIGTQWSTYYFGWIFKQFKNTQSLLSISFINSAIYFVVVNFIGLPLTLILSFFIFKKIFGHKFFRVIFFLPSVISGVVLATLFGLLLNPNKGPVPQILQTLFNLPRPPQLLYNTNPYIRVIVISIYTLWTGFGINLIMFNSAMARIPSDVIEYGKIEGVGLWRELMQLVIPMILPTLTTVFIIGMTGFFTFIQPVMLLNPVAEGDFTKATSIAFYIYFLGPGGMPPQLEKASAIGVLCSAIGVPVIMVIRYFVNKFATIADY